MTLLKIKCESCGKLNKYEFRVIEPDKRYTINEIIEKRLLGFSRRWINKAIKEGHIQSELIKLNGKGRGRRLILGAEIINYLNK